MKLVSGSFACVSLPFVEKFSHSLGSRAASESVLVSVQTGQGVTGWGEGMPRTYVTGEDFDSCLKHAETVLWPRLRQRDLDPKDLSGLLSLLDDLLPSRATDGTIAHNAVRCAFELAVVDAWLRTQGRGLGDELPRTRDEVAYSAVIPTGSVDSTTSHAKQYKMLGFEQVKVKIDGREDVARMQAVRAVFGPTASLRVDGNAAYTVEAALASLSAIIDLRVDKTAAPAENIYSRVDKTGGPAADIDSRVDKVTSAAGNPVDSAEQMLARGSVADWAELTARSAVPIMVDESLVTEEDAAQLIAAKACHLFNIRVSKCGGIGPTLRIIEKARAAGVGFQLGCHVGESAILSAVGRHLACHLGDLKFVEGSFGTLLLKEDIARETVRFGHRGRAKFIAGPGFGVEVRADVVARYAVRSLALG